MSNQNLIIYKFNLLFQIFEEIGLDQSFNIISINDENLLHDKIKNFKNYLVISHKKKLDIQNQIIFSCIPSPTYTPSIRKARTSHLTKYKTLKSLTKPVDHMDITASV